MKSITNKNISFRWLIVEDALRDQKGHWFEYISTFWRGLQELGDEVTILADREAQPFILEYLKALPVLPPSIWHRMSDGANPLIRYLRLPIHAWETVRAIKRFWSQNNHYDVIFVPTILVHHLLAWTWLIKYYLPKRQTRVILFFPNAPVNADLATGKYGWTDSLTTRLLRFLLKVLIPEVQSGQVILGAETYPMQKALTTLSGVPFIYFPHPVEPLSTESIESSSPKKKLVMGSYGAARHEKGSDILYRAISDFHNIYPDSDIQFILQCLEGFEAEKALVSTHTNVTWLNRYFQAGEYPNYLHETDVMLLPYRLFSYCLRVSRVVIEAMVNGIVVIATDGTTLADQADEFGALVKCKNQDYVSLAQAIHYAVTHDRELKAQARDVVPRAQAHFSVEYFRQIFITIPYRSF
ncbi:glycosyltransferase [Calothrix sp. FACHB-1219]|uniref:glycosyltransferase n=1 Tax=unclassified Calothrix TaxID=2619626 RepID=UPI001684962E|nr:MULTISPECIES: glycosyltransferase [unclassified Calothrix]MBD2201180.1 glycosyltransferase [Calothrix sp. FACHB-168]MBD2215614.1 glycosyltransferase [Calothrix sp. FACHB-1219]